MEVIIKKKIGKETYPFVIAGNNLHELIMESQKLSFDDVDKCGICGSDRLILNARIAGPKKYKYVEVKCRGCKSALVFGNMTESPDTYYLRKIQKDNQKVYDWKEYNPEDDLNKKNNK